MHKQHQCSSGGDATAGCDPDTEGRHVTSIVSVSSNLPGAFDSTSLKTMFMEVGPVIDCFMVNGEGSDITRGFVQFTTTQDAEKAIREKNGFPLSGKNIVVELANVQAVVFGGLDNSDVAREVIRQAREIGSVLSVNYPLDEMDLYGLTQDGCACAASILFEDGKSAKSVVSSLHHKEVEGVIVWACPLGAEEFFKGDDDISFGSTKIKQKLESDKGEQLVTDTKEKVWLTPCSDSTEVIDKRVKMLLSASTEDSHPQLDFYGGPQIFNTVTWPLDGPAWKVKAGHLYASGHQRLWHFVRGQLLDVSSVLGPDTVIFTTAMLGTFYMKITFEDHSVTLPIDGREGWNYGIENEHGRFEYDHKSMICPYLANGRNWSMLQGCLPDYGKKGLCPTGNHEDVEMGIPAARRSCKTLSTYKGELPVPPEVRKACATLITYGIEAVKSNEVLDWTCATLEDDDEEFTLGMLHPYASPRIKRWKVLGQSKLHYLVRKLDGEEDIFPTIPAVTGIETTEGLLDSVCVIPYNIMFRRRLSKARDWSSFPLDKNSDMAGGRPHFLSAQFAFPWPTNSKLAVLRSPDTMINAQSILPFAKVKRDNLGLGELSAARTFSPGAGAALRIQKRNFGAMHIPNARTFTSGAGAALRILKSFVK